MIHKEDEDNNDSKNILNGYLVFIKMKYLNIKKKKKSLSNYRLEEIAYNLFSRQRIKSTKKAWGSVLIDKIKIECWHKICQLVKFKVQKY